MTPTECPYCHAPVVDAGPDSPRHVNGVRPAAPATTGGCEFCDPLPDSGEPWVPDYVPPYGA
jgi:hypothetical protein